LPRLPNGAQATAKLVLLYLAERAGGNGVCWPSFAAIVEATGSTLHAVNRAVRRLTALGLVVATRRSDALGRRSASRYELRVAAPAAATAPEVLRLPRQARAPDPASDRAASPAPGPALPRPTDHGAWQTVADRYGLRARPGEDWPTFQARIRAFIERAAAQ
jgi:hypothetical protein